MWEPFISYTDFSFLKRGDYVKITFSPNSQKHFSDPNYDYYFPTYEGKIISSNIKNLEDILIKDNLGKTHQCINRAGTSGFMDAYYCKERQEQQEYS